MKDEINKTPLLRGGIYELYFHIVPTLRLTSITNSANQAQYHGFWSFNDSIFTLSNNNDCIIVFIEYKFQITTTYTKIRV